MLAQIQVRLPTEEDQKLPWLDHTTTAAIHRCPRYGIVRYHKGLAIPSIGEKRALPLELGHAVHQCTAVNRLFHCVRQHRGLVEALPTLVRLFGDERAHVIHQHFNAEGPEQAVLETLYTSGYYDDPYDRKRTLSNAEASLLYYLQQYDLAEYRPMVLSGVPQIEIPIHYVVTFTDGSTETSIRYVGRADGLHWHGDNPAVHDDKTASNVANNWDTQWYTSHQITGYMIGAALILEQPVAHAMVLGLQIPLPSSAYNGFKPVNLERHPRQFVDFFQWLHHAVKIIQEYDDSIWDAPTFTHSCYSHFRPCSFVPLCSGSEEDFTFGQEQLVYDKWDPLKED